MDSEKKQKLKEKLEKEVNSKSKDIQLAQLSASLLIMNAIEDTLKKINIPLTDDIKSPLVLQINEYIEQYGVSVSELIMKVVKFGATLEKIERDKESAAEFTANSMFDKWA